MIAGTVKAYNLPIDYVLYDLSYANMIMYGAVLPSYNNDNRGKGERGKEQEVIKADDPKNKDKIREFLSQIN